MIIYVNPAIVRVMEIGYNIGINVTHEEAANMIIIIEVFIKSFLVSISSLA
jgi:hypothetical protein